MIPKDASAFEIDMDERVGPTILGQRAGTLRFAAGRLSFTNTKGEVRFEAPLTEFHSPAAAELGTAIEIWQGGLRHRLVATEGVTARYWPSGLTDDALGGVLALDAARSNVAQYRNQKEAARSMLAFLEQQVGPRPPDQKVRTPAGPVRYVLTTLAVVVSLTAALVGLVWWLFA